MMWGNRKWRSPVDALRACHTCKNCGRQGLIWDLYYGKYQLLERDMTLHTCQEQDILRHAAASFEDCDK